MKILDQPYVLIAAGTLAIALGGLCATYGWNLYSTRQTRAMLNQAREDERQSHRRALLTALTAEVGINEEFAAQSRFTEPDNANLAAFTVYPRFRHQALSSVLTSGRFNACTDGEFVSLARDLSVAIDEINHRLDLTEQMILADPKSAQMWRSKLRDSGWLKELRVRLGAMKELLETQFRTDGSGGHTLGVTAPR